MCVCVFPVPCARSPRLPHWLSRRGRRFNVSSTLQICHSALSHTICSVIRTYEMYTGFRFHSAAHRSLMEELTIWKPQALSRKNNSFISPPHRTPHNDTTYTFVHVCLCALQRVERVGEGVSARLLGSVLFLLSPPHAFGRNGRTHIRTAMCVTGQMTDWYQLKCFAIVNALWSCCVLLNTRINACSAAHTARSHGYTCTHV